MQLATEQQACHICNGSAWCELQQDQDADLEAMLPEIVDSPTPPSLIVGLLVGHVPNEVRLAGDVHFDHNQQAGEVGVCCVSCQLGACGAICQILLVWWDERQQANTLTSLLNGHICSTRSHCPAAVCAWSPSGLAHSMHEAVRGSTSADVGAVMLGHCASHSARLCSDVL